MMNELVTVFEPLVLTLVIEIPAAWLSGIRGKKDLFLIFLVNCITNPLLVIFSLILMYNTGIRQGIILTYLVLEPVVIYAEYRLFRSFLEARRDPLRLSLLINLLSIFGGVLWQKIF